MPSIVRPLRGLGCAIPPAPADDPGCEGAHDHRPAPRRPARRPRAGRGRGHDAPEPAPAPRRPPTPSAGHGASPRATSPAPTMPRARPPETLARPAGPPAGPPCPRRRRAPRDLRDLPGRRRGHGRPLRRGSCPRTRRSAGRPSCSCAARRGRSCCTSTTTSPGRGGRTGASGVAGRSRSPPTRPTASRSSSSCATGRPPPPATSPASPTSSAPASRQLGPERGRDRPAGHERGERRRRARRCRRRVPAGPRGARARRARRPRRGPPPRDRPPERRLQLGRRSPARPRRPSSRRCGSAGRPRLRARRRLGRRRTPTRGRGARALAAGDLGAAVRASTLGTLRTPAPPACCRAPASAPPRCTCPRAATRPAPGGPRPCRRPSCAPPSARSSPPAPPTASPTTAGSTCATPTPPAGLREPVRPDARRLQPEAGVLRLPGPRQPARLTSAANARWALRELSIRQSASLRTLNHTTRADLRAPPELAEHAVGSRPPCCRPARRCRPRRARSACGGEPVQEVQRRAEGHAERPPSAPEHGRAAVEAGQPEDVDLRPARVLRGRGSTRPPGTRPSGRCGRRPRAKIAWTWRQARTNSPRRLPLARSAHGNQRPFISCAKRSRTGRP